MVAAKPVVRGWFSTPGRPGDRRLEDQLKGLDWLFANVRGKTVLDLGCAEGLISIKLAQRGALAVHGVDVVAEHLGVGNKLRGDLPVTFEQADLNHWRPKFQYDIVIALALMHKLKNPTAACAAFADAARHAVVLRLPPEHAPTVIDERSRGEPHHLEQTLNAAGLFRHDAHYGGHFGEYVGVWLRA